MSGGEEMNTNECERLMRTLDHLAASAISDDTGKTIIGISKDDFRTNMIDASVTINSFLAERKDYLRKLDAIVTAFLK